jgi:uncharacterized membrane protein (DUF4010 family)
MTAADLNFQALQPFLTAVAIGLLLGLEREWSHRGGARQAAGSRTFALLALGGAIAASLGPWVAAAGLAATGVLLAIGYARTSEADPGLTTEVAAGATYLLGALAWRESALAVALAVLVAGLLVSKARLHLLARRTITEVEVEDAVKFLITAFVVLPLLPDQDLGPFGALNPRRIWLLVVMLTGFGWVGYLAVRILGSSRGLLFAGLAGGFVSAIATTAAMAQRAREEIARTTDAPTEAARVIRGPLAAALAASLSTLLQLSGVLALVNLSLLERLLPALAFAALILTGLAAAGASRIENNPCETVPTSRPFALRPALILAAVLTAALLAARFATVWLGDQGAVLASGLVGFVDAHAGALAAATLSARGELGPPEAVLAIGASLGTNTLVKVVVAFVVGGGRFGGRFAAAVLAAALGFAVVVLLGR